MNILFLTPKSEVAYIYSNDTLRQTLEDGVSQIYGDSDY